MREQHIRAGKGDATTNACIDTIKREKQALVFCASKRAAESQAEKVAKQNKPSTTTTKSHLAEQALGALSQPTDQCKRLAYCLEREVAFHHAGLPSKQRELIETEFRAGTIKVICSTPTLAAGLDLPAFRAIIRDYKRFGGRGMTPIPVLEYLQMAGRAGRPGMEEFGEALLVASKKDDVKGLTDAYINGTVEDIHSKLAVEPVLRTYILSLVATGIIQTEDELNTFFSETFYAKQFGNMKRLEATLKKMIGLLKKWEFLETSKNEQEDEKQSGTSSMFMTASDLQRERTERQNEPLVATPLGKRVSEIYLDPLTAHMLLEGLEELESHKKPKEDEHQVFAVHHLISCALEMRPLIRMKAATSEIVEARRQEQEIVLLDEAEFYEYSQDDYEDTILTANVLNEWCEEASEQYLLDKYGIRPGEITMKLQRSEWLLYACEELARVTKRKNLLSIIRHIAMRTKHGVKPELIALLQFRGIGRVRARALHAHDITTVSDVKRESLGTIAQIVGPNMARQLKEQAGVSVSEEEFKHSEKESRQKTKQAKEKRTGQTSLEHF